MAICLVLILSVFLVYARVCQFDFIAYDDDLYVARNSQVQAGLTPASIKWAFTAIASNNWLPVTLLSHMLDVQLFGLDSGLHHLVNVVLHGLASLLLFLALRRATGDRWRSAFVAFVFALHPLHVESVAWISERKDVLSAFFFFLTLYAYICYAERPELGRYLAVVGAFCLGLMSKPMVVTLPFVLLLCDVWPLRRVNGRPLRIVLEKLPLAGLSALACVITYRIQSATGAVGTAVPLPTRLAKAVLSYGTYIKEAIWPAHLAVFYPYPQSIPVLPVLATLLFLLIVTVLVVGRSFSSSIQDPKGRRYLAVGWFWYLGTLVPVIGLVQAGQQSHADRYTYIPLVGLSIMLAWGAADAVERWPAAGNAIAGIAAVCSILYVSSTWQQVTYWRNSETLFDHAIDVTSGNWLAHGNLGQYLLRFPDRRADAVEHLETAVRIKPDYAEGHNNLGLSLLRIDLCDAAIPHFEASLHAKYLPEAANNLAWCLTSSGRYGEAISYLETALRVRPDYPEAHFNLGMALSKIPGREAQAVEQYEAVLRARPDFVEAHQNLARLLVTLGRSQEAISHLITAESLRPDPVAAKLLETIRTHP